MHDGHRLEQRVDALLGNQPADEQQASGRLIGRRVAQRDAIGDVADVHLWQPLAKMRHVVP
jgi:hypothetical protein